MQNVFKRKYLVCDIPFYFFYEFNFYYLHFIVNEYESQLY